MSTSGSATWAFISDISATRAPTISPTFTGNVTIGEGGTLRTKDAGGDGNIISGNSITSSGTISASDITNTFTITTSSLLVDTIKLGSATPISTWPSSGGNFYTWRLQDYHPGKTDAEINSGNQGMWFPLESSGVSIAAPNNYFHTIPWDSLGTRFVHVVVGGLRAPATAGPGLGISFNIQANFLRKMSFGQSDNATFLYYTTHMSYPHNNLPLPLSEAGSGASLVFACDGTTWKYSSPGHTYSSCGLGVPGVQPGSVIANFSMPPSIVDPAAPAQSQIYLPHVAGPDAVPYTANDNHLAPVAGISLTISYVA